MKKKLLTRIFISIFCCLSVGMIAAVATQSSVKTWYVTLNKPPFTPPNWLFAPVWTILYIMMGIATGIVWAKGLHHKWVKTALNHFIFQLILNLVWSFIFFTFKLPLLAFFVIFALAVALGFTMKWFRWVNKLAFYLLIPYFLWVCFAAVLNLSIWSLN
ncbi:TspO/MBR family protein [Zhouia sp. PK063]|uniref:TspO/MBR family protein n=1 Tax=Zhouia sp. PK063 TaxID=3373602 RepID=UPI0037B33A64